MSFNIRGPIREAIFSSLLTKLNISNLRDFRNEIAYFESKMTKVLPFVDK